MAAGSILIVDDDEATCDVLALALRGEGYACRQAHSLKEALAHLRQGPPPDLILLDLLLPDARGTEALQQLASALDFGVVPVVIMSAWEKAAEIARAAHLELLAKPFSLARVEEIVRRLTLRP
jgi:CheY-like chemotaxis protein